MLKSEIVYKAMTRPAMVFGVPLIPFILVCCLFALIAVYTHIALALLAVPIIYTMKMMAKKDDLIFRLYGFKLLFASNPKNKSFYGVKSYSATNYNKRKLDKFDIPHIEILASKTMKQKITDLSPMPSFEKFVPYEVLVKNVIMTKNYDFIVSYGLEGVDFQVESDEDNDYTKNVLHSFLKQCLNEKISFYFHSVRVNTKENLISNFNNEFARSLNDDYFKGINQYALRENKLFLTLIYSPFDKTTKSSFRNFFSSEALTNRDKQIQQQIREMEKICVNLETALNVFSPIRLTDYIYENKIYNSQLEFLNSLYNCQNFPVLKLKSPIFSFLKGNLNNIQFSQNIGLITLNDGSKKYFKAVEFQDYPSETYIGILDELLFLDVDYVITQSFVPINTKEAKEALKAQRKRLISAEDDGVSQVLELDNALDQLTNNEIGFGEYHFSIVIYADSKTAIDKASSLVASTINNCGFITTQANIALAATYFGQFPANFAYRPRLHKISTLNLASLVSLHSFGRGKMHKNAWGDAITMFKTPNGTPYFFNFHETDFQKDQFGDMVLANSLVIGKSGGGKTMLMNFILAQMTKFADKASFPTDLPDNAKKLTMFYLDKDKGAIGNIMALGGKYIIVKDGENSGFNPFMVESTNENLNKLKTLMKMLVTRNGEILTTLEEENLNRAVESVMRFPIEDRQYGISLVLEHLTEGSDETNSMKSRLNLWKSGNKFGWVFDNAIDNFKFDNDEINIYGIDGTDLLANAEVNGVVSFYILWRIFSVCDGRRYACFIDEAWDWIRNETVADFVFDKEKTIRKLNGFLVLGTQSVEDFAKSPIARAILEQSATLVLLANDKAQEEDYCKALNLSKEVYEFVKTTMKTDYKFLTIKDQRFKTISTMDLSFLDKKYLKILSTGKAYTEPLEQILDKKLPYLEQLQEIYRLYEGDK